jgi:poly(glycerol-phosphate) alpha-glucosyltransferase
VVTLRRLELPAGSHYAVLDALPPRFNGMTASTLQRSRAFAQLAGVNVTILTWEDRPDNDEVRRQLREKGLLVDGMQVMNMWDEARQWDDAYLAAASFERPIPDGFEPLGERGETTGAFRRALHADDGRLRQIDCLRADGTVLAAYLYAESGAEEALVLCDRQSRPLGAWHSTPGLQRHWLDSLRREPVAWMIFDSKVSAAMLADYQRPDVLKIHVVRGSHLKRGTGPMRDLVTSRQSVMENLDAWDSVTFLTKRQRDDVAARFGERPNLHVIPNSRNAPERLRRSVRPRGRGVMVASLEARKRVSHAVRAMARVRRRVPRRRPRLDVWGAGPMEAELRALIEARQAPVRLHGFSPDAREQFSKASFSVLTSRSEGLPGVLIESMGRGCIPVSYDMPYGPSDIITHGVDGFLVPDGDSLALADQITRIVRAKRSELAPMRKAARARALEFNDEHVVGLWSTVMAEIADRRGL